MPPRRSGDVGDESSIAIVADAAAVGIESGHRLQRDSSAASSSTANQLAAGHAFAGATVSGGVATRASPTSALAAPERGQAPGHDPAARPMAAPAAASPCAARPQQQAHDEAAFVRAFAATRIVQATLKSRWKSAKGWDRVPTSVAGVERRWFVGKHTMEKAKMQAALLAPALDRIGTADTPLTLAGTAAMFELAAQGTGMVHIEPCPKVPGLIEVRLAVASRRRGRPARQVPTPVQSASATEPDSGWSLTREDGGVFAYGVRRYLWQHGWTCPPWDDSGNGTCCKAWRSLVDNKRTQLRKRAKPTPVAKTLRQDTIDKWDGRAQQPGYTLALCHAVLAFNDSRAIEDTAASHENVEENCRTYFVDSTVAAACRQFAEQESRSPNSAAPRLAPSESAAAAAVPAARNLNLDSEQFGLDNHSTSISALEVTLGSDVETEPWPLGWAGDWTWSASVGNSESWSDSRSDPESWTNTDLLHTSNPGSIDHSSDHTQFSSNGGDAEDSIPIDLAERISDTDGGYSSGQSDSNTELVDGVASSHQGEVWGVYESQGKSSFKSSFGSVATAQPSKRSLDGEWYQTSSEDGSAAAGSALKLQKTAARLGPNQPRRRRQIAAAAGVFGGAVALIFVIFSAGQEPTSQQPSMDPRVVPRPVHWHCIAEPNSVMPQWTQNDLCKSDPTATFSCDVESIRDPCVTRHGVLVGRICRCDGCFTGGQCMFWEHRNAYDDEPCADTTELGTTLSSGGTDNQTTCYCTGNGNEIQCSNGEIRFCSTDQDCTSKIWNKFDYGDWSSCEVRLHGAWPQWRQQLPDDTSARRFSSAIMWMGDNTTLLVYLFASGLQCPDPSVHGPASQRSSNASMAFNDERKQGSTFTIGACPIEGVGRQKSCGGEGNEGGNGDICTGGLYSYSVTSNEWTNFYTNKDLQVKEMFQFDVDRQKFVPGARNDAVQWSERPMGGSGVFIFGGVGCAVEPFGLSPCVPTNLVDLWYFDIQSMWFPLGGFADDDQTQQNIAQGSWPDWQSGRAAWSSPANYSASNNFAAAASGGELWMFGGLIQDTMMNLIGSAGGAERPTADLWCYEYSDSHTLGNWKHVSMPFTAPAARYAATAWGRAGTKSAAAYIYGGVGVDQGADKSQSGSGSAAPHLLLQDLWSFNGDKDRPIFTQILPPQLNFPGANSWPPPGVGDGWVRAQKLWLWASPRMDLAKSDTPAAAQAGLNELWVFSTQVHQWERVGAAGIGTTRVAHGQHMADGSIGSKNRTNGSLALVWPGQRGGALVADGFVLGGVGYSECTGAEASQKQSLVGLWRLTGGE